jgi:hypothetical protein
MAIERRGERHGACARGLVELERATNVWSCPGLRRE